MSVAFVRVPRADCRQQQKASRHSASAPSQHRQRTSTEEETSELRFGAAHPHANVTTASAALTVATSSQLKFFPPAHPVICGDARRAARTYAAGSGGEGSSEPVVGRTTASSSSRPARTCVQRVSVRGAGQGQAAGRRRHSVPRPVHPPHRQQRGAGAVECYSQPNHKRAAPKGIRARQASLRTVGLSPGGGGGACGLRPSSASRFAGSSKS